MLVLHTSNKTTLFAKQLCPHDRDDLEMATKWKEKIYGVIVAVVTICGGSIAPINSI